MIYLDLKHFRWPASAVVSIMHRLSGALLFLSLPWLLWLLNRSLQGEAGFQSVQTLRDSWWFALLLFPWLWGVWHHIFAGIRFLLLDVHQGTGRERSLQTARWVQWAGFIMAILSTVAL